MCLDIHDYDDDADHDTDDDTEVDADDDTMAPLRTPVAFGQLPTIMAF